MMKRRETRLHSFRLPSSAKSLKIQPVIAVPDFAAGAMENPGAITFRDWLILLDPQNRHQRAKAAPCA